MLELREYQKRSLEALESYLRLTVQHGAKMAFLHQTERPYRAVPQLPALPYVCLRVPTGGGKTLMACHAAGIAVKEYLQAERAVCLWLVPTNTIRAQTLAALRDRQHPYRQAVDAHFDGNVTVMDLTEALYVPRGTLRGDTCIIVSTLAALRVEDTEGRKVYEMCGALMDHFSGLTAEQEALLEKNGDGVVPYSLCNVLRLHRPIVIMDEAHNARTRLSFETLARFNPSCVIEFTATPETTHRPEGGLFASNILCHVSAAELKAEDMVKLPIKLETRSEWKEVVAEALQTQRRLEQIAQEEERQTGEYLRPLVLFQAQPRSQTRETLTVEVVRQTLMEDFRIPEDQIAVATGQTREIGDVDLFARDCPIRFIITVAALKEGWDCSFAYVLCSVAEIGSARAVEQVLGRVLRLPRAQRKQHAELNCAYAFAASRRFMEAATSLKDALVENGFQRMEAELYVSGEQVQPALFGPDTLFDAAQQPAAAAQEPFRVPMLAVRVDGQIELFEDQFRDTPWRLSKCDAVLSEAEFPSEYVAGTTGEIDVSDHGKVEVHFVEEIHRQRRLLGMESGWDLPGLTNWLDRRISHPDITRTEATLFIHRVLTGLIESRGLAIEQLAGRKFRLRTALAEKIDQHRRTAAHDAFKRLLFSDTAVEVEVGPEVCFEFSPDRYAANWYYEGSYRFRKHFFRLVGELRSEGEEYDCAVFLDQLDAVKHWVRNLERRPECSFWLQTSTDKFYPDFVAQLNDGRILVVEYKGEDRWSNEDSREKRAVGELWADRSNGHCLFVMPKGPDWGAIGAAIRPK